MRWLAFSLLLISCASSTPPAQEEKQAEEKPTDPCVDECVLKNQMRAVSAQQIQADCEKQCSASK